MWKVAFISMLLFLGVSAGALYYQWDEYHTEATKQSVLQHDIEATFTGKTIEVVHHIRGAVADTYEVTVPKEVTNISCAKKKNVRRTKKMGKRSSTHRKQIHFRSLIACRLFQKNRFSFNNGSFIFIRHSRNKRTYRSPMLFIRKGYGQQTESSLVTSINRLFLFSCGRKKADKPFRFIFNRNRCSQRLTVI